MSLTTKLFGTYSERQIKKLMPVVDEVEALASKYAAMTDAELSSVTPALKARLAAGETLDDILPDAFAAVREAAARVSGIDQATPRGVEDMRKAVAALKAALAGRTDARAALRRAVLRRVRDWAALRRDGQPDAGGLARTRL